MPLISLPVLGGIALLITNIGKWFFEFFVVYGKKIVFLTIIIGMFFTALYTISTAIFAASNSIGASSAYAAVTPYLTYAIALFPTNFYSLFSLILALEFQVFFFRWAIKVLDIKAQFLS